MKTHVPAKKNGSILVIVVVVLVAVSLMVAALLQLGSLNQIETVRQLRMTQAHWLAEAGLERALSRIYGSATYRNGLPKTFSNDETLLSGLGSYEVEITKVSVFGSDLDDYTITSIGKFANNAMVVTNAVRLNFRGGSGLQTVLMGLSSSTSTIAANVKTDGPIFQDGVLNIAQGSSIELGGPIEATGGVTGNSDEATQVDLQNPDGPLIKVAILADYSAKRDYARSTNASPYISKEAISLAGGIKYYKAGKTTLNGPITGSGTIVVSDDLDVKTPIPANVNLIAGGIINLNGTTLGGNNKVFAFRDIDVTKCEFTLGSFVGLVAMEGVKITSNFKDFTGLIYAGGTYRELAGTPPLSYGVIFESGIQFMYGSIIAWKGFYLGSNATIMYDASVFDKSDDFVNYANGFAHLSNSWQWAESPF